MKKVREGTLMGTENAISIIVGGGSNSRLHSRYQFHRNYSRSSLLACSIARSSIFVQGFSDSCPYVMQNHTFDATTFIKTELKLCISIYNT